MTTEKKGTTIAAVATKGKETVKKAINVAVELLRQGMSETQFNMGLDRMVLANAKNDYSDDARVARANKLLERVEKLEAKYAGVMDDNGQPLKSIADWKPLADFFNRTLAHLSEKAFTIDSDINAANFLKKAKFQKVTEEQKEVVRAFYKNRAKANWDRVLYIRTLLERKHLLKKVAAQLPTPEELAAMNQD